jgi:hypothetical protein
MSEDSILQAVMDEKLFGALEVDLHVPDDLKFKFSEIPLVFKNIYVSRDDIGDHMKAYAEEKGVMNQKRKWLNIHHVPASRNSAITSVKLGVPEMPIQRRR